MSLDKTGGVGRDVWSRHIESIARERDRAAFAAIFNHFAPRVKAFMRRNGASEAQAEDVAQEAMLAVWRKASLYNPSASGAATWIFTIARNLRIDLSRREARVASPDDPSRYEPGPAAPDEALSAVEDEGRIGRALATLPREQAQVVALAFFADKPHSEIAKDLGLPLGTVKSRLRLAMGRLRGALAESRP